MKLLLASLLFIPTVSAQQPRIVNQMYATETVPIAVEQPEVSKAYYGDLKGEPEFYRVQSQDTFNLHIDVLVPSMNGADANVSAEIIKNFTNGEVLHELNAEDAQWSKLENHLSGETYLQGPKLDVAEMESGTYYVKVHSPGNRGKYVLVIGQQESFPYSELAKALISLPKVRVYFDQSPLAVLGSSTMWVFTFRLLLPFLIIAGGLGFWWWKKKKRK